MLSVDEITDAAKWDSALSRLPAGHILQSWAWTETKAQTGWRAQRLLWHVNGGPAASAALLWRRLSATLPVAVGYVPKGPALDWSDTELAGQVLREIQEEARRRRAIFVKIDPDVRADTAIGQTVQSILAQRGWRVSDEQIQFRNTMITDLAPD